ncbi:MAG: hypothetical protein ACU0CI_11610 [Shimia sp.]
MSDLRAAEAIVEDMSAAIDVDPARRAEFAAKGYDWCGLGPWHEVDDAEQAAIEFRPPVHAAPPTCSAGLDSSFAGLDRVTDDTKIRVAGMVLSTEASSAPWPGIPPSRPPALPPARHAPLWCAPPGRGRRDRR